MILLFLLDKLKSVRSITDNFTTDYRFKNIYNRNAKTSTKTVIHLQKLKYLKKYINIVISISVYAKE